MKMKIAILSYKPIKGVPTGYSLPILTISNILTRIGHKVEIFSISDINKDEFVYKKIVQHHIKGAKYYESGFGLRRVIDFIYLFFFGYRPSIKKLSNNPGLIEAVKKYNPDLIIVSQAPMLSDLAIKSLQELKKAKLIVYTDSFGLIEASFNTIKYAPVPNLVKTFLLNLLYKKYIGYMKTLYKNLLKHSTVIITPTSKDKYKILHDFQIKQKKIVVIPLITIKPKGAFKQIQINKIKTITFIGAADYGPNIEAVNAIKRKIAPRLKNIRFIIVGKGWKKEKNDNVEVLGEVKNLKPIFDKTDAFIAPITTGVGMKTKIATYLEAGKPIIGTSVAFEGYGIKDKVNGIVENQVEKTYKRIEELNKNPKLIKAIQKNMRLLAKAFSEEALTEKWRVVIKK